MIGFLKKILIGFIFVPFFSFAQTAPYDFQQSTTFWDFSSNGQAETDMSKVARSQITQDPNSLLNQLIAFFNLSAFKTPDSGTFYIRTVVNYALALVALISTVSLMLGFYRMFTSDNGTEAFARALKLVKGSIIAIFLLGFSWVIVSFLLNTFVKISSPVVDTTASNDSVIKTVTNQ